MSRARDLTPEEAARVEQVFTEHQEFIEAVATSHAPSYDHVPDIMQAVGVRLCHSLSNFRSESELTTWLYRMTVNAARSHYQEEARQRRIAEAAHAIPMTTVDQDSQHDLLLVSERQRAVRAAIAKLRPLYQQVVCNEMDGSSVLSGNESTARSRRLRAKRHLKDVLEGDPRIEL